MANPLQDVFNAQRLAIIGALASAGGMQVVQNIANGRGPDVVDVPEELLSKFLDVVGSGEQAIGTALFDTLIATAAGDKLRDLGSGEEADAVDMIKRLLGFGAILPLATGGIVQYLEGVLGDHAPKALLDSIRELPQEIGVNFFIGTVLERIFETAVSVPLEEAIAYRTRPARIEWQQLRALARTKTLSDAELEQRLKLIGFRDEDIPLVLKIDKQLIPIGDLQQAYLDGIFTETEVLDKIKQQGFDDADAETIKAIYISKAQTEAGSLYRTVARSAFANGRISEAQFRSILAEVNTPRASIDLETEALKLQHDAGRTHLTVAEIQRLWIEGSLNEGQARAQLTDLGYSDADITELFTLWTNQAKSGKTGLTQQRVLSFLVSGVIDAAKAYDLLTGSGTRPQDASFLVAHPGAAGTVYARTLTDNLVISAYKEGVLTQDEAATKLHELNVEPATASLMLQTAAAAIGKAGKHRQATKTLDIALIKEAFDLGLASDIWAERELETIGYSQGDAALIVAEWYTKNNGSVPDGWSTLN